MRFQVLYCLYLHEAKLTGEVECLINKLPKPGPKSLLWILPSLTCVRTQPKIEKTSIKPKLHDWESI